MRVRRQEASICERAIAARAIALAAARRSPNPTLTSSSSSSSSPASSSSQGMKRSAASPSTSARSVVRETCAAKARSSSEPPRAAEERAAAAASADLSLSGALAPRSRRRRISLSGAAEARARASRFAREVLCGRAPRRRVRFTVALPGQTGRRAARAHAVAQRVRAESREPEDLVSRSSERAALWRGPGRALFTERTRLLECTQIPRFPSRARRKKGTQLARRDLAVGRDHHHATEREPRRGAEAASPPNHRFQVAVPQQ